MRFDYVLQTAPLLGLAACAVLCAAASAAAEDQPGAAAIRAVGMTDADNGASAAVIVPDVPLLHTEQIFPVDRNGLAVHPGDAARQFAAVWERLQRLLAGRDAARLVKLNLYVASDEVAGEVRAALARKTVDLPQPPAVSCVVSALPFTHALVALDAVAALPQSGGPSADSSVELFVAEGVRGTLMPAGARIYVSGQAEKGADLTEATRRTLESLDRTLTFLGLQRGRDVVQLKAFLTPMADADAVRAEVRRFFGPGRAPPLVLVEWESSLPIEIELIAWGGAARTDAPVVEYLTPPGLSSSSVFSRVARINHGPTIYVSGLFAGSGKSAEDEVNETFGSLRQILGECGGDLRHLAKATYYVSSAEASQALGTLRPKYYDPTRPPAASKAQVQSVGRVGRTLALDLIAVPAVKP